MPLLNSALLQQIIRYRIVPHSQVFAKDVSASRYLAGALTNDSAHESILDKDPQVLYSYYYAPQIFEIM